MSWFMGGVSGEGQVSGSKLNVRNKGGRMLWVCETKNDPSKHRGNTPFELAGPRAACVGAIPVVS